MDDMMELMDANGLLGRRLEAYAEFRLSPDLATSSRLRARVLAVAHRQAALASADAALTILPRADAENAPTSDAARDRHRISSLPRSRRWSRAAGAFLAASLATAIVVGGVTAARPGGPLYETRLWAETLTLPGDPSARAVAELGRLRDRLREVGEADRAGDAWGAMMALAAYESILEQASASAILAGDDVAAAVLETGVGWNIEVLRALADRAPTTASAAITRALDAAIARSTDAVERISASRPGGGQDGGGGPNGDSGAGSPPNPPHATEAPTAEPTPESDSTATPKPKPTRNPTAAPAATHAPTEPTGPPDDEATPKPGKTPDHTPRPTPDRGGPPDDPPGGGPPSKGD
jgi:hypothetical protein